MHRPLLNSNSKALKCNEIIYLPKFRILQKAQNSKFLILLLVFLYGPSYFALRLFPCIVFVISFHFRELLLLVDL